MKKRSDAFERIWQSGRKKCKPLSRDALRDYADSLRIEVSINSVPIQFFLPRQKTWDGEPFGISTTIGDAFFEEIETLEEKLNEIWFKSDTHAYIQFSIMISNFFVKKTFQLSGEDVFTYIPWCAKMVRQAYFWKTWSGSMFRTPGAVVMTCIVTNNFGVGISDTMPTLPMIPEQEWKSSHACRWEYTDKQITEYYQYLRMLTNREKFLLFVDAVRNDYIRNREETEMERDKKVFYAKSKSEYEEEKKYYPKISYTKVKDLGIVSSRLYRPLDSDLNSLLETFKKNGWHDIEKWLDDVVLKKELTDEQKDVFAYVSRFKHTFDVKRLEPGHVGSIFKQTRHFMQYTASEFERDALAAYRGKAYYDMNNIEEILEKDEQMREDYEDDILNKSSFLQQLILDEKSPRIDVDNAFVWRGTVNKHTDPLSTNVYMTTVPGEIESTGMRFTSTSYGVPSNYFVGLTCCLMKIYLPRGFPCLAAAANIIDYSGENEIILPRHTKLKFIMQEYTNFNDRIIDTFVYEAQPYDNWDMKLDFDFEFDSDSDSIGCNLCSNSFRQMQMCGKCDTIYCSQKCANQDWERHSELCKK